MTTDYKTEIKIRTIENRQTGMVSDGRVNTVKTMRGKDGHRRRHTPAPTCGTRQQSGPYLV